MSKKTSIMTVLTLGLAFNAGAVLAEPPKEVKELDIDITIVGENDSPDDVVNQIQLPDFSNLSNTSSRSSSDASDDNSGKSDQSKGARPENPGIQGRVRAREKGAPGMQNNPGLETREQVQEQVRERISGKGKGKENVGLPPEVEEIVERARGRSDEKKPDTGKPEKPNPPGN